MTGHHAPLPQEHEWFRVTLASIGDAVIATDTDGNISFMNPVAEALTGWTSADARGKCIDLVFNIINEYTRKPASNPIARVLREGVVVGLANHTVLISRNGSEFPIDDSAAPIRDPNGRMVGVVLVFHDITERRKTETALIESERRFRLMIDAVRDYAIFRLDTTGHVASWNSGAERIKQYRADEIIGSHFSRFYPPEDIQRGKPDEELKIAIRDGRYEEEGWRLRKDGSRFWASVVITAVRDESGRLMGFAKVTRDMTERKNAEEALRQANNDLERRVKERTAELEKASRLKDSFLATVSHELRTPLTPMLGWARMIRSGQLDSAGIERGIQIIERNVQLQTRIIEDLLDISRIVTGKLKIDAAAVGLAQIVEAAMEVVRTSAEAKSISLEFKMLGSVGPIVGDAARLQQVVWNLLSNAIRFTPAHGKIRVELERVEGNAELRVLDSGEGISPDYLPHVFDRFSQADNSSRRRHGGLGIGLSIVKHLVELHGGTVQASSPGLGKGSTFTVRLPLSQQVMKLDSGYPLGSIQLSKASSLQGVKVMIVDDELDSRDFVQMVLSQFGAEVRAVESAKAALDEIQEFAPNVLVSDIGMPEQDGFDLIRALRAREGSGKRTPAVALTAFARVEDRERALAEGFQSHLPKPIEPAELVRVVSQLAGK